MRKLQTDVSLLRLDSFPALTHTPRRFSRSCIHGASYGPQHTAVITTHTSSSSSSSSTISYRLAEGSGGRTPDFSSPFLLHSIALMQLTTLVGIEEETWRNSWLIQSNWCCMVRESVWGEGRVESPILTEPHKIWSFLISLGHNPPCGWSRLE